MNHRTLEEYKEELQSLTKDECLEYMYQMSEQICNAIEYITKHEEYYGDYMGNGEYQMYSMMGANNLRTPYIKSRPVLEILGGDE